MGVKGADVASNEGVWLHDEASAQAHQRKMKLPVSALSAEHLVGQVCACVSRP